MSVIKQKTKKSRQTRFIRSINIELCVQPKSNESLPITVFAAREIVKLGLAKRAKAIPSGIRVVGVRENQIEELLSHTKSMGASRWWIAN